MGSHSRYSPSATERDYSCPASHRHNNKPDAKRESSVFADEGTAAHHLGEQALVNGRDTDFYEGTRISVDSDSGRTRFVAAAFEEKPGVRVFDVDEDMVRYVGQYVDWCRELPGQHFVEVRVNHSKWCPDTGEDQFGTSDHVACIPEGDPVYKVATIVVTDLKYGQGVRVYAKENKQGIKYALGAWDEYDWLYGFEKVVIRIAQPRLGHFDVWELTVAELLEWGDRILERLELTLLPDAPYGPSEKACKFCDHAPVCQALRDHLYDQAVLGFDDLTGDPTVAEDDLPAVEEVDLLNAYSMLGLYKVRVEAIEREVRRRLMRGEAVGELYLAETQGRRAWSVDPEKIAEIFSTFGIAETDLYVQELKSPAQAEKLLPRKPRSKVQQEDWAKDREKVEALWARPKGQPAIASPGDGRPKFERGDLNDFDAFGE